MTYYAITSTRHGRRATDTTDTTDIDAAPLRRFRHTWELVSVGGGVLGTYCRADYGRAIADAATMRHGCGMICDVRKAAHA